MSLKKVFLIKLLIVALVTAETCEYRDYCVRHRKFMLEGLQNPSSKGKYTLDPDSVSIDNNKGLLRG